MSLPEKSRGGRVGAIGAPSRFAQLPRELLFKILDETDNTAIFSCAETLPFLKTAGIDILLQRHGVPDPSVYCEVQAIIPGDITRRPLPDALSALVISNRRYTSMKHLHCSIRPPEEYDSRLGLRHPDEQKFMMGEGPLADRTKYTFKRLSELLGRTDAVEEVTLKLLYWRRFPPCLSALLEDFVHTLLRKGCSTLQVLCPGDPFNDRPWTFPVQINAPPPRRLTLSSMFSSLCGLFSSSTPQESRQGHRRLGSNPAPILYPRLTKLNVDSSFFHPSGVQWMADLLVHSPLTDFTVSMNCGTPTTWFTNHGLSALVEGVPRLQSLSVLNATVKDIVDIAPRLRPFTVLKNLTISLDNSYDTLEDYQGSATPFAPAKLQRLSVSSGLVDYMLLGTVTALNLQEIEITYGKVRSYKPRTIGDDVASVRDFFDKISVPISVGVKLPSAGSLIETNRPYDDGSPDPEETQRILARHWMVIDDPISPSFIEEAQEQKEQNQANPLRIDTLSLELYPETLRLLDPSDLDRTVELAECFPNVKKVVLGGVRDFRDAHNPQGAKVPEVVRSIVQPMYSRCTSLTSLWIGEEEYSRPLLEI